MGTKFRTMLAPIGMSTGDGRRFKAGGITLAPTPFSFEWVRQREGGHDGAVAIGIVQEAVVASVADALTGEWTSPDVVKSLGLSNDAEAVWGRGEIFDDVSREDMPRLAEDVAEAVHLISQGILGPSVDLDSFEGVPVFEGTDEPITFDDFERVYEETGEEPKIELLITQGRVRAATLVSIPAFMETCQPLELITEDTAGLTASVTGSTDLPVAEREHAWDGPGAARRVFEHFTDGDSVDAAGIAGAFLYRDPDADPQTQAAYKLGFADVLDGTLTIVPRGVAACAGGRGVDSTEGIPDAEKTKIKSRICTLYGKIRSKFEDWPECPFDSGSQASARTAALIASIAAVPTLPLAASFAAPALDGPTPITIDFETGRVFGHIAEWRTCHVGYADVCVTPPKDQSGNYAWFNRFPVETEEGTVWAGRLTVGGRHPGLNLTASATMAAYDGKTVAAYIRASSDEFGIVVSGVLSPDLDEGTRAVLSRRKVSGDWRETPEGLSLVELLALSPGPRLHSEPGFPVATHSRNGRQVSLTAAFGPEVTSRRVMLTDIRAEVRAMMASERLREEARAALAAMLGDR